MDSVQSETKPAFSLLSRFFSHLNCLFCNWDFWLTTILSYLCNSSCDCYKLNAGGCLRWLWGLFHEHLAPRSVGRSVSEAAAILHTHIHTHTEAHGSEWWKGGKTRPQNRLLQRNVHSKGLWRRQEIYTESSGPKEGCFHALEASARAVRWVSLWQDWSVQKHITFSAGLSQ